MAKSKYEMKKQSMGLLNEINSEIAEKFRKLPLHKRTRKNKRIIRSSIISYRLAKARKAYAKAKPVSYIFAENAYDLIVQDQKREERAKKISKAFIETGKYLTGAVIGAALVFGAGPCQNYSNQHKLRHEIKSLQEINMALRKDIEKKQSTLEETIKQYEASRSKCDTDVEAIRKQYDDMIKKANEALQKANRRADENVKELEKAKNKYHDLKKSYDKLIKEGTAGLNAQEVAKAKKAMEDMRNAMNEANRQYGLLQEKYQKTVDDLENLKKQLNPNNMPNKGSVGDLENKLKEANDENANLREQLKMTKKVYEDLKRDYDNMAKGVLEAAAMKKALDEIKDNYDILKNDYKIAQARIEKYDKDLAEKTKDINKLNKQVKSLEDSLQEQERIRVNTKVEEISDKAAWYVEYCAEPGEEYLKIKARPLTEGEDPKSLQNNRVYCAAALTIADKLLKQGIIENDQHAQIYKAVADLEFDRINGFYALTDKSGEAAAMKKLNKEQFMKAVEAAKK